MKQQEQVFACDACHYIFAAAAPCTQCPDCGKQATRPANEQEREEYLSRKKNTSKEAEEWD